MSIKEKLAAAGITDEATMNALSELFETQQSEIAKLTQVKENLFDDKAKWKTDRDAALLEAENARNEAARKAGDVETLEANLKAQHEAEVGKYKDQLAQRDKQILGRAKDSVISQLAAEFIDPDVGRMMLANMVGTSYSESGEVATVLNGLDGQSLTTDAATFAETVRGIPAFASVLKGVDSSGGGSQGNQSGGGAGGLQNKSYSDLTLSERAKLNSQ